MELENTQKAIEFLKSFIPNGLWVLTAIDPAKKRNIETRTFSEATADQAEDWLLERNGVDNLYFSVNQPEQGDYRKKLSKDQIAVVHYLHVDIDPQDGQEIEPEQNRIFRKLTTTRPEAIPLPTTIVKSGGGYQAFWRLSEPQIVENKNQRDSIEMFNKWLEQLLGADNCHNLDRIMRLPWTVNIPTQKKREAGRVEALAKVTNNDPNAIYKLSDFSLEVEETPEGDQGKAEPKKTDYTDLDAKITEEMRQGPIRVEEIEDFGAEYGIPRRTLHIIVDGEGDEDEKIKKAQAGKEYSRSEWLFDVLCELERRNVPRRLMLGIITEPNVDKYRISESVNSNTDRGTPLDYADRQIRRAAKMVARARQIQHDVAGSMGALNLQAKRNELYKLCRGDRPNLAQVETRKEAEDLDPLLKALNSFLRFVLSVGGGKPRVCTWSPRPEIGAGKTIMLEKTTVPEFHLQYKGLKVVTGYGKDKSGVEDKTKPTFKPLSEWWLEHRFKNLKSRIAFVPEGIDRDLLNEWTGFTYPEETGGKYDLFLEHMRENICNGNEDHFTYLKKWCARMYQKPGKVGEVGVFLRGGAGVGKSVFAQVLGNMVETNFFKTAQTKKLSNFNSVLRTTVLLFLDEPSLELREYDVLKRLLTDNSLDIEAKGFEIENAANNLHILFASNHEKIAQLDTDDRRLCVLQVGDNRKGDEDYFGAIFDQLEENDNAGYKALFHFFRNLDLAGFKVRLYPKTAILAEQKELSLAPKEKWLLDRLEDGEIIQGTGLWPELVASGKVREDFTEEMKNYQKTPDASISKHALGIFLIKTIGVVSKGQNIREKGTASVSAYKFPLLPEARANWEKSYGPRNWNTVEDNPIPVAEPETETEVTEGKYGKDNTPF